MPTSLAELISDRMVCPTGRDDSRATDRDLLDRVVPLWLSDCGTRPSLRFGSALLSNKSASGCTGRWQLHLFTFATEARLAQQTMALIAPHIPCEAGTRATGEGLLLLHEAEGDFDCRIIDRRKTKPAEGPLGSWQVSQTLARRAVLHVPRRTAERAAIAARMLALEFDDAEESAQLHAAMAGKCSDRSPTCIRPQDIVDAANRMLEPVGMELTCSDRRVRAAIDAHLPEIARQVEATVERIAHQLVAELAQGGSVT